MLSYVLFFPWWLICFATIRFNSKLKYSNWGSLLHIPGDNISFLYHFGMNKICHANSAAQVQKKKKRFLNGKHKNAE